ncbi:MAG: AMP-binding protein [Lachnospiraceae bacterium]|nr:AMP-binding protein [Lachnospiraceae bacterium]
MDKKVVDKELLEIATRIKAAREIAGLTEAQMAEKTGVTVEEYCTLEQGKSDFDFTFIFKCANVFGVGIKDLLEGESATLSLYTVTRKGEGLPITRRTGFEYLNLAPDFKKKLAEPFYVTIPYDEDEELHFGSHKGHEIDIVIKGRMMIQIGDRTEILGEGDTVYYNSGIPHAIKALDGQDCVIYAIVVKPSPLDNSYVVHEPNVGQFKLESSKATVSDKFVEVTEDEKGGLKEVKFKNTERFNFAYDIVDELANKCPNKTALMWVGEKQQDHAFTFADMKKYSNMTANYFESIGIGKGDKVLVILKKHYQYWFTMLALHKIGAIAIPAVNQLLEHDLTYRYKAAGVKAVVVTASGDIARQAELACKDFPDMIKILVGEQRPGWHDFNGEMMLHSDKYDRKADTACGKDPLFMMFTSGTTGNPNIAIHDHTYPLASYITAKYWFRVNPDGLHFTISDTGWIMSLWGKLYGSWMLEAGYFAYDYERFHAEELLPMFGKYGITTLCAATTIYRMLIKQDITQYDFSSLENVSTAGEALNPEVYERFKELTGLSIMEGYGQTETAVLAGNFAGHSPKIGSMGRPNPLYDIHILDEEGNDCKAGETGEICVKASKGGHSVGLFNGYYENDEKTDSIWYDGYYHTGDQAWFDERGCIRFVGRIDDVIKSSGYRIGPFEIESVIMELPYVLECAITPVPDEVRGQLVKATIVLVEGKEATEDLKKEIQTYVKTHTAPYKYPRIVEFVKELPKTVSGKIKRKELREKDKK